MITEPQLGTLTGHLLGCSTEATVKLVIIVGIEQIMLAVVLVVQYSLNRRQGLLQTGAIGNGFR